MTKLGTYILIIVSTISFGQEYKTFKDSMFKVGDIIKAPDVVYYLDGNGHENDSTLQKIADFANSHKSIVFEIGSHTDSRGSAASNFTLSTARAENIKEALVTNFSVDANQLRSKGYGSSKPIISDGEIKKAKTKELRENLHALNRRTELKILEIRR